MTCYTYIAPQRVLTRLLTGPYGYGTECGTARVPRATTHAACAYNVRVPRATTHAACAYKVLLLT